MARIFIESLAVVALAAVLMLGDWSVRAQSFADRIHFGLPTLTRREANRLKQSGKSIFWVEVRSDDATSSASAHVLHLSTWDEDLNELLQSWDPEDILIVTGDSKARPMVRKAAERLDRAGLPAVYLLAWEDSRS